MPNFPLPPRLRAIPCLRIGQLPTPLHGLPALRRALGPDSPRILIKRDDLIGTALGGNKIRKLEYLLADAREEGCDTLITCGAAQSNHALQTAAAAGRFGFGARCVLFGEEPEGRPTGNLRLHEILGTPITWVAREAGETRSEQALRRGLARAGEEARAKGLRPYLIPTGGSTALGAVAFARAVFEVMGQLREERVQGIYFASGSGGTHAGILAGARAAWLHAQVYGVEVDPLAIPRDAPSPYAVAIARLAEEASQRFEDDEQFEPDKVGLCTGFGGAAYGAPTAECDEAIRLLARTEGIFVDPVYTGKALSALVAHVRAGRYTADETILFWHTGGAAGLFA